MSPALSAGRDMAMGSRDGSRHSDNSDDADPDAADESLGGHDSNGHDSNDANGEERKQPVLDGEVEKEEVEGVEEEEEEDDDDASASDSSSNYSSVSEDPLPPIYAYGHSYHGSGRIVMPNDKLENDRQKYQHELFTLVLGGALTFTKLPLDGLTAESPPFHILDVGSGGGFWAVEMAQTNACVDVLGIELSGLHLPKEVPPNLTFEIADAAEKWPPRLYDFIHMRNLVGGGIRDWKALLHEAYAHLKPGGQLEFTEITPLVFGADPDPAGAETVENLEEGGRRVRAVAGLACIEYGILFHDISKEQGLDFDPAPKIGPWLLELGAEGLRQRSDWLPVRSWGSDPLIRKKGELLNKMVECGIDSWPLRMFGLAGWEEHETKALLARVQQEMENPVLRSCIKVTFTTAKKPLRKHDIVHQNDQ
ncbi:Methyltransferase pytC [Cladobotryum mycophilum]|uniref:Methyltransferase pytC n=1 Tax=Cladobotryum mycophilum TaxID=491253 RepID=A0ABR0S810_9HYPO